MRKGVKSGVLEMERTREPAFTAMKTRQKFPATFPNLVHSTPFRLLGNAETADINELMSGRTVLSLYAAALRRCGRDGGASPSWCATPSTTDYKNGTFSVWFLRPSCRPSSSATYSWTPSLWLSPRRPAASLSPVSLLPSVARRACSLWWFPMFSNWACHSTRLSPVLCVNSNPLVAPRYRGSVSTMCWWAPTP